MVGATARLIRAIAGVGAVVLSAGIEAAPAPAWVVDAACREGHPQGRYELRDGDGQLRVAGAFNDGRRAGSFIFWSGAGVRLAHIPFDDDARNGTLALWHDGPAGREPVRWLESVWHHGVRDGQTRSWFGDGRPRDESEYVEGRLAASRGWTDAGERLTDDVALERARADAATEDAYFSALDQIVRDHLPRCD